MRAAIFNPYLDTLGGGERYTMVVATTLLKAGYKVDVEWVSDEIRKKLEDRFGIDLSQVNFVKDIKRGEGYDVCFWVSDGSIPTLSARNNLLHFQIPFKNVGGKSLVNKMKLFRIKKIICNSYFTKGVIDKEFGVNSEVLYPPVSVADFKSGKKEKLILNVGRFSQLKQAKRQDVLVDVFKKLYDGGEKDWKLILAGGVEIGAESFVSRLKEMSKTYPIKIVESPAFLELKKIYAKADLFWSASGFEIDEENEPDRVEHFGITVVESMASGAIAMVYKSGGHKEIIKDSVNGFLWSSKDELLVKTRRIISDIKLAKTLKTNAKKDSEQYSQKRFEEELLDFLK